MKKVLLEEMEKLLTFNQFVVANSSRNGVPDTVLPSKGVFNFASGFALYVYHIPENKPFLGDIEKEQSGFYVTYQRSGYETTAHDNYIDENDVEKFMRAMKSQSMSLASF